MYKINYDINAQKKIKKLDANVQKQLITWINKHLLECTNPKQSGKSLIGNHLGEWSYRVGNYRIIADISEKNSTILILDIGHRKNIYQT